jgi:hypothetical protein
MSGSSVGSSSEVNSLISFATAENIGENIEELDETMEKLDIEETMGNHILAKRTSSLMRYGGVIFSPSSWEPQEEGMINIAARFFPQLRYQGMSIRRGRSQYD